MKRLAIGLLVLSSMLAAENSIAQQSINTPPDTIFFGGKIITVDSAFTIAQAFAVRGEQYIAVGSDSAIRALAGAKPGAIILLHDGGGDRSQTVAALPRILRGLRKKRLRSVTVSRLMAGSPPPRGQDAPPANGG